MRSLSPSYGIPSNGFTRSEFVSSGCTSSLHPFLCVLLRSRFLLLSRFQMKLRRVNRQIDPNDSIFKTLHESCASTARNHSAWQQCYKASLDSVAAFKQQVLSRESRATKFQLCLQRAKGEAAGGVPTFTKVHACFKSPFITYAGCPFGSHLCS